MIRTLPLVCSRCGKTFSAQDRLYYQDDFSVQGFKDIKLVCDDCIRAWKEKWQIGYAEYHEHNYVLTVTITLKYGLHAAGGCGVGDHRGRYSAGSPACAV